MSETTFTGQGLTAPWWRRAWTEMKWAVPAYLMASLLLGMLIAPVWALGVDRPGYTVLPDLTARIGERDLAHIFSADAWFALITAILGLIVGFVGWLMFHRTGPWVCLLTILGAGASSLGVWQAGLLIGQRNFDERLANASPGDVVAVDLALHAHSALLVAPFAAMTVVMLCAAFYPERTSRVRELATLRADMLEQATGAKD